MAEITLEIAGTPSWRVLEPLKSFGRYVVQDRAWWQERVARAVHAAGVHGGYEWLALEVDWGKKNLAPGAEKQARLVREVHAALRFAGLAIPADEPTVTFAQSGYGRGTTRITLAQP